MKLFNYQEKAVDELIKSSERLLESDNSDKYILLKAITGAGKTVISSEYIKRMCDQYMNIAFVWISVGKGGLHEQSRNSLREKLPSPISVKMADEALTNDSLRPKDVLVLNWESLNTKKKDKKTGEEYFDNIFMRNGEGRNLQELWRKTKSNGTTIVLIIDESHNTAGSSTSKEIIELISPAFVLEVTATPKENPPTKDDENNDQAFYVPISTKDVIQEGVIKRSIKLNDMANLDNVESSIELMVKQAIIKRNQLKEGYLSEGVSINPLAIIQLPDGQEGNTLKDIVISILQKVGITLSNRKLGIWLSDDKDKINLESITNLEDSVEFLIFKQAPVLGWDCPRASILVKLRNTKSEEFNLQTIGRILRMPERKHYSTGILNHGYIYTNSDYSLNTGDYTEVLPSRQILKPEFKAEVLKLTFPSEKTKLGHVSVDFKAIEDSFHEYIQTQNLNHIMDDLKFVIKTSTVQTMAFDNKANTNIETSVEGEKDFILTPQDINRDYEKFVKSLSDNLYTYKSISNLLLRYFSSLPKSKGTFINAKKLVLLNKIVISQIFSEIKVKNKASLSTLTYVEKKDFSFKEDRHTINKDTTSYEKCAYYKHFVSKHGTERTFEAYLEDLEQVEYWIKNVDSGDGLSIVYEYKCEKHEFYPDYVVKFKDGSIGIFEVKDIGDQEKDTITASKMKVLEKYANKNGFLFGKVEIEKNKVYQPTLPIELKR